LKLATSWQDPWQPEYVGTLVFVLHNDEVLLIHKKTGHGQGKVNAPGGKLEHGERLSVCAARETSEEVGIEVTDLVCRAELRFVEQQGPQWLGYAFTTRAYSGTPIETAEANPFWCRQADIPYARMWDDDRIWLPQILAQESRGEAGFLIADLLFRGGRLLEHVSYEGNRLKTAIEV
jgi:8-oxo-dGTP diphosphatase